MFLRKIAVLIFCIAVTASSSWVHAQEMEMHATNPEAIKEMRMAFSNLAHDMDKFGMHIDQAYQLDATMPMANLFIGMNPEGSEATKAAMAAAQAYSGPLSEGEKIFLEMGKHIDDEDYKAGPLMIKLVALYPNDPVAYLMAGYALAQEESEQAATYLKKAWETGKLPAALNMLGYTYLGMGDPETALSYFDQYIAAAPDHYNPYDSKGDYFMAVQDYAAAAESFEKAATMNPSESIHKEKAAKAREMMNK